MNIKITLLLGALAIVSSSFAQISFDVKNESTWSSAEEFDYNLTSYLTNNSTNELSDTAFEWFITGVDMPAEWDVTVCSGLACIPNPTGLYDFNLGIGKEEVFKLGFSFFDAIGNGTALVVARSKMDNSILDSFRLSIRAGSPVSVENNANKSAFRVYPNPAKDKVTVSFASGGTRLVMIYDILGSLKKSQLMTSGSTINVSDLTKGVYIMKIEGDKTYSKMIQKQ
jgi:hypothetical protein